MSADKYKNIDGVECKFCSTCKQYRALADYSTRKASPDSLAYSCKQCDRETARQSYLKRQIRKKQERATR